MGANENGALGFFARMFANLILGFWCCFYVERGRAVVVGRGPPTFYYLTKCSKVVQYDT